MVSCEYLHQRDRLEGPGQHPRLEWSESVHVLFDSNGTEMLYISLQGGTVAPGKSELHGSIKTRDGYEGTANLTEFPASAFVYVNTASPPRAGVTATSGDITGELRFSRPGAMIQEAVRGANGISFSGAENNMYLWARVENLTRIEFVMNNDTEGRTEAFLEHSVSPVRPFYLAYEDATITANLTLNATPQQPMPSKINATIRKTDNTLGLHYYANAKARDVRADVTLRGSATDYITGRLSPVPSQAFLTTSWDGNKIDATFERSDDFAGPGPNVWVAGQRAGAEYLNAAVQGIPTRIGFGIDPDAASTDEPCLFYLTVPEVVPQAQVRWGRGVASAPGWAREQGFRSDTSWLALDVSDHARAQLDARLFGLGTSSICKPRTSSLEEEMETGLKATVAVGATPNLRVSYKNGTQFAKFEAVDLSAGTYSFAQDKNNISYAGHPITSARLEGKLDFKRPIFGHYLDEFTIDATNVPAGFSYESMGNKTTLFATGPLGSLGANLVVVKRGGGASDVGAGALPAFELDASLLQAESVDIRLSPTGAMVYDRNTTNRIQINLRNTFQFGVHLQDLDGVYLKSDPEEGLVVRNLRVAPHSSLSLVFRAPETRPVKDIVATIPAMPDALDLEIIGSNCEHKTSITPRGSMLRQIRLELGENRFAGDECTWGFGVTTRNIVVLVEDIPPGRAYTIGKIVRAGILHEVTSFMDGDVHVVDRVGRYFTNTSFGGGRYSKLSLTNAGPADIWADMDGDATFPGAPQILGAVADNSTNIDVDMHWDSVGLYFSGRVFMNRSAQEAGKVFQVAATITGAVSEAFKTWVWDVSQTHPVFRAIRDGQNFQAPDSAWTETVM